VGGVAESSTIQRIGRGAGFLSEFAARRDVLPVRPPGAFRMGYADGVPADYSGATG
jgi:hypothetical protein